MTTWQSAPRRKVKVTRPDKYCEFCGRRISPGRSGRRVYCSNACKQAAYRLRLGVTAANSESNRG